MLSLVMVCEICLKSGDFRICTDFWIISYLMLSFAFSFVIEIVIKEKSSCSLSDRGDFLILGMYIDFLCSLY